MKANFYRSVSSLKHQRSIFSTNISCKSNLKSCSYFSNFHDFLNPDRNYSQLITVRNCSGGSVPLNYKAVFIGSDHFSLPSLIALTRFLTPENVSVVVSHENNVIGKYAKERKLELFQWKDFKTVGFDEEIARRRDAGNGFDFGVVASFGYLIPARVIDRFPLGILNVHASLLPKWRGASPIAHSIIYGDSTTGVSIMKIAPRKFDVGPILLQSHVPLHPHIRSPELNKILSEVGADALSSVVSDLNRYVSDPIPQDDRLASLAPKLCSDMGEIDWHLLSSARVYNLFRGLCGFSKLKTSFLNRQVDLDDIGLIDLAVGESSLSNINEGLKDNSTVLNSKTDFGQFYSHPCQLFLKSLPLNSSPGQIIYKKDAGIVCVKCSESGESSDRLSSWIFVGRVKIGGKWMSAKDFQNGFLSKCKPEERLFLHRAKNIESFVSVSKKIPG